MLIALSKCIKRYDINKLEIFAFDIGEKEESNILSILRTYEISEDILIGSTLFSNDAEIFYQKCYRKTVNANYLAMPLIVYKGADGEIYTYTMGRQSNEVDNICKNIEEGGLASIETDSGSVINVEYHTILEIEDYMSKSGVIEKNAITYKREPVTSGNYDPGELSSDTLNSALAILNQMRYIAGISYDITLNDEYNKKAQAAALLNDVNKGLSHYPQQPFDMSDSLYQLGYEGASHSNLTGGYANFYSSIIGWLSDSGDDNINRVGHRRWILNPNMEQTGFGAISVSIYAIAAMYATDGSKSSNIKVTWPAQNMPTTYFDAFDAWSVSINKYVDKSTVYVTLTRKDDNKQWYFSEKSSDGYFNVDNQGYGQIGCIIFRPELSGENYADGDLFNVDITYGEGQHLTYNVQFFEPFKMYNITYELNGGTNNSENPDSFRVFSDTIILKDPAKKYGTFEGWYTDSQFKNKITKIEKGTNRDITLYAKWNDIVSEITLNQSSVTLNLGEKFQLEAQIRSDNNTGSAEWKTSNETVATVSENGLVTAKSEGTAVITATSYGKQAECIVKVSGATKPPKADIPTNTEVGKGTLVTLTSDTQGAVIRYTTDGSTPTEKSSIYNQPIAIYQDTTIKAYASSADSADSEVVTFVYTLKSFTVTFDTDGGTAISSLKVYQNDSIDEPDEPTKPEYHFAGWYLNGNHYDFNAPVTENITLMSVWREYEMLPSPKANFKTGMVIETGTRVALSHDIAGVSLYYTTDGSIPTEKSAEYKNAIVVKAETTIKAIAVKKGYKNSEVSVFHYTVAEKGSLWGDVSPEDIPSSGSIPEEMWVTGIKDATYTGKAVTHDIHVYDGSTLLVEKRDYTVSYKNNIKAAKKSDSKAPAVIISGKGNYKDKIVIPFNINQKNLSDSDVIADEMAIAYTGKMKKVVPVIRYRQKKLANNKDFVITNPIEYSDAGKYVIKVEGKGNYTGTRDITLMVTKDVLISKASVSKISDQTYDGKEKTPEITVKLKKTLEQDKDYTLTYVDNREIGTASVIIKGKGEYSGTKRISFRIISPYKGGKYDIGEDIEELVDVDIDSKVLFSKGGSTPAIKVSFNGKRLIQGKDYTVSFKNNKTAYSVSGKEASAIITGKGNYCGKIDKRFTIERKDISQTILAVSDAIYTGKSKGHQTKFVLTDVDGKALKAGTDYEKEIVYTYAKATELEIGESRTAGETVKDTDVIPVDTVINVTIKGTGSYEKTITGSYRVIAKEKNISKAKVTLKNPQYYTGSAVKPDKNQFEVKLGNTILNPDEYSIVCYTNNVKKGNASVTIRGEGIYGGTKTAKFLIGSKTVNNIEP